MDHWWMTFIALSGVTQETRVPLVPKVIGLIEHDSLMKQRNVTTTKWSHHGVKQGFSHMFYIYIYISMDWVKGNLQENPIRY